MNLIGIKFLITNYLKLLMITRIKSFIKKSRLFEWIIGLAIWPIIISTFFPVFKFTKNCEGFEGFEGRGTLYDCAIDILMWVFAFGVLAFITVLIYGLILVIFDWIKSKL